MVEDVTKETEEIVNKATGTEKDIMSAYLNKNQDTLNIINSINGLKQIKEKVVKLYNDYTR